jgi:hypothetical protein
MERRTKVSDGINDGEITFGGVEFVLLYYRWHPDANAMWHGSPTKFSGALTEFRNVNQQGFWVRAISFASYSRH